MGIANLTKPSLDTKILSKMQSETKSHLKIIHLANLCSKSQAFRVWQVCVSLHKHCSYISLAFIHEDSISRSIYRAQEGKIFISGFECLSPLKYPLCLYLVDILSLLYPNPAKLDQCLTQIRLFFLEKNYYFG